MISIKEGRVQLKGTIEEIMEEYMDITSTIYYEVLKADESTEMDAFFKEGLRFSLLKEKEKETELLKMKNKNAILERIIKNFKEEEGEE